MDSLKGKKSKNNFLKNLNEVKYKIYKKLNPNFNYNTFMDISKAKNT